MKINDYGLNAYKKNSSKETSNKMEKDLTVKKAVKNLNSEKSVKITPRSSPRGVVLIKCF